MPRLAVYDRSSSVIPTWPKPCDHIVRGYFGLGDNEQLVQVTSSADFLLYVWA